MSLSLQPLSLSLRGITKRFGSTCALEHAELDVRGGTLHALLGENGAGKTTLMRMAFGMLQPDAGEIMVGGAIQRFRSSASAIAAGIGMVHQHFLLVNAMTVAENVALGEARGTRWFGRFNPRRTAARVRTIGVESGLVLDPSTRVTELSVGAQQRLEIVKALAREARLLILDEPTATLSPDEAQELYRWLRAFVDRGGTVVLITHKIREALGIADAVTVLRRGRTVLSGCPASLTESEVVTALLGQRRHVSVPQARTERVETGDVVMRLDGASVWDRSGITRLHDTSIEIRAGEVVGVVGVEGSGQRELLRLLAGRLVPNRGRVSRPEAVGFVPEDRVQDGLIPELSLIENAALVGAGAGWGQMPWQALSRSVAQLIDAFDVRTAGPHARARELSGGNQQKFLLGRELSTATRALVVENPTRGLDMVAAESITRNIVRAAHQLGVAVVYYSNDVEEVLQVSDRILVCFAGRVREAVSQSPEEVARAMVGAA